MSTSTLELHCLSLQRRACKALIKLPNIELICGSDIGLLVPSCNAKQPAKQSAQPRLKINSKKTRKLENVSRQIICSSLAPKKKKIIITGNKIKSKVFLCFYFPSLRSPCSEYGCECKERYTRSGLPLILHGY